jgi:excisionase family DNA binding protein
MAEDLPQDCIFRPLTVRVREACRLTGIGRSKLYELIAAGEIEVIKVGTITLLPVAGLERFLKQRISPTTKAHRSSAIIEVPQTAVR